MAAFAGFLAVALGAFGAHGLEGRLSPEAQNWWQTATLYALVHSVAALAISISGRIDNMRMAGWTFILGTILFSGSLYALALGAPRWMGAITPLGGVSFLSGWALCVWGAVKN